MVRRLPMLSLLRLLGLVAAFGTTAALLLHRAFGGDRAFFDFSDMWLRNRHRSAR